MGQVWQATDTQLNRQVALKILPDAFAADPDRLARFKREAQILASLNHPNIAAIYGIEETEGTRALVLELFEGPTLADRISKGPIALDEALPIAKQIAEALEAAHETGVIHRDLKPANIKVREDGTVKVLDFGLAKAFQPDAGDASASMSPTISLTAAATQMGMVIGTAAYMAPEQAKGLTVDKRADIWAYGAVLFEMLTGRKLFDAGDVSEMLASVLVKDPDISSIGSHVPAHIRSVVRQCLVKDPKERLRDIGDVRLAMKGTFETTVSTQTEPAVVPTLPVWQQPVPLVVAGLLVAVVSSLAVWTLMRSDIVQADLMRFVLVPPESAPFGPVGNRPDLTISPDGTQIVYVGPAPGGGGPQLNLRPVDQLVGAPLRGGEGGHGPFVSPNGEWVGFVQFVSRTTLQKVSIFGGPPVAVTESPSNIFGASWGTDDQIIFGTLDGGLFRVPGGGGEPEALTTPDAEQGETSHSWPFIIPDRNAVLFVIGSGQFNQTLNTGQLAVLDLNTEEVTRLGLAGVSPHYVSTGHLVHAAEDGSVRAVPFDARSLEVTGNPVPLVEGVMVKATGAADFSISDNKRLVYVAGTAAGTLRTLVWVDRDGREEPLTDLAAADYRSVDVSPDGSALALEIADGQGSDIWTYELGRGTLNPLTTDPAVDQNPLWTPDGRQVVFESGRDAGSWGLYRRNADGTGAAEPLITDDEAQALVANTWSQEGDRLVVMRRISNQNDLMLLSMEDEPALELLLESEFQETRAAVSPDGDWIAYESRRSGGDEIYVERFPDFGDRQTISTDGGQQPRWSPDGRALFYLGPQANRLMVVAVTTETGLSVGTPETVIEGQFFDFLSRSAYDVAPDDRLVLIRRGADTSENEATPQITVVLNWHEELLERVPVP